MPRYAFLCAVVLVGCTTTSSPASPAAPAAAPSEAVAPAPSEPAPAPALTTAAPAAPPVAIAPEEPKRPRPAAAAEAQKSIDPATTVKVSPQNRGCNRMYCADGCCGQCRYGDWIAYGEPELALTGLALPEPKVTPCGPAFDLTLHGERREGSFVVKSFERVTRPKFKPNPKPALGALKKKGVGEE
jgi:hypothetical protein